MNRGKRYKGEQKLNLKKVFAVIIALIVLVMFVICSLLLINDFITIATSTASLTYYGVITEILALIVIIITHIYEIYKSYQFYKFMNKDLDRIKHKKN